MSDSKKTVVVTGGTRGIGKSIVMQLLHSGFKVAGLYGSNKEQAAKMTEEVRMQGFLEDRFSVFQTSVVNQEDIKATFQQIREQFGPICGLVNNAGITRDGFLMTMKEEDWNQVLSTNLLGVMQCSAQIIPYLEENQSGTIVNMASISGVKGTASQTNYATTKSAIIGFTRSLAVELAPKNIEVYSIAPGYIDTEMLSTIPAKILNQYKADIPMQRFGSTDEIGVLVSLLAEGSLKYATGHNFIMDGGVCCK